MKKTKIVCTLGPSCESLDMIVSMIKAGMNVARLNFSHGTYQNHAMLIKNIRNAEKITGQSVGIILDLQGPKIRVGIMPENGVELRIGDSVVFDTSKDKYNGKEIPVDFKKLHKFIKEGQRILLHDGRIETVVHKVNRTKIHTKVVVGGLVTSHKGINLPDSDLKISSLTAKDKKDVFFGIKHNVDFFALSFVTTEKDVKELRFLIKNYQKKNKNKSKHPIGIIAKIERALAVKNLKNILDEADGMMVARGDLGVEIPAQEVPIVQKKMIGLALEIAKPVIVATQMLDSMQQNPRPTRAEVSDVANAVIDHTDAVMLSNETAVGKYPLETVQVMSSIILETENSCYNDLDITDHNSKLMKTDDAICQTARIVSEKIGAKLIIAASLSGRTGRLISRYRPELSVVVVTNSQKVLHQLNLSWGIYPFLLHENKSIEQLTVESLKILKKKEIIKKGDKVVLIAGIPVGRSGNMNLLEVKEVK